MTPAPKRGLGRGLGSLIPTQPEAHTARVDVAHGTSEVVSSSTSDIGAVYAELPIDSIVPNPRQPRSVFDEEALAELVHSIREIGLLQPVVVRTATADVEGDYELIAGERRLRASKLAGLHAIPAIIRQTDDDDLLRDALLENLHRANLNPLEEAAAYQQLLADFGCTQDELARRIGRSRPQVSNTLRLLKLPADVQRRVAAGVISAGHARALLSLPDAQAMDALAARIVAEGLSVRSVEEIVLVSDAVTEPKRKPRQSKERSAAMEELASLVANRLSDALDTRVHVDGLVRSNARARIVIEVADADDLRRVADVIQAQ